MELPCCDWRCVCLPWCASFRKWRERQEFRGIIITIDALLNFENQKKERKESWSRCLTRRCTIRQVSWWWWWWWWCLFDADNNIILHSPVQDYRPEIREAHQHIPSFHEKEWWNNRGMRGVWGVVGWNLSLAVIASWILSFWRVGDGGAEIQFRALGTVDNLTFKIL